MNSNRNDSGGQSGSRERTPLHWEMDRIFTRAGTIEDAASHNGLAIKVNKAEADGGKIFFSVELGRINHEGIFIRFLQPKIERGANFSALVSFPHVADYAEIMYDVQTHVEIQIQQNFDQQLDRRREKEESDLARAKPQAKPGLKQLSKQSKQTSDK